MEKEILIDREAFLEPIVVVFMLKESFEDAWSSRVLVVYAALARSKDDFLLWLRQVDMGRKQFPRQQNLC